MRIAHVVTLLALALACGSPSTPERGEPVTTAAGGEATTAPRGEAAAGPIAHGVGEHECALRQQRECAALACRWTEAEPRAEPEPPSRGEDTSLRDDVHIGPRRVTDEAEGRACVRRDETGAAVACPELCCTTCPRE